MMKQNQEKSQFSPIKKQEVHAADANAAEENRTGILTGLAHIPGISFRAQAIVAFE